MAKIVAVTGCPTGIAHTIMAAEALKKTAAVMGHEIKVETQGSEGVKSALGDEDIAAADVVIVSSDIHVDLKRFAGKPMVAVTTSEAIRKTKAVIEDALAEAETLETAADSGSQATGGSHLVPDRYSAHLHGCRGPAQGGGSIGPRDQG